MMYNLELALWVRWSEKAEMNGRRKEWHNCAGMARVGRGGEQATGNTKEEGSEQWVRHYFTAHSIPSCLARVFFRPSSYFFAYTLMYYYCGKPLKYPPSLCLPCFILVYQQISHSEACLQVLCSALICCILAAFCILHSSLFILLNSPPSWWVLLSRAFFILQKKGKAHKI